jgi:hypothetical protein
MGTGDAYLDARHCPSSPSWFAAKTGAHCGSRSRRLAHLPNDVCLVRLIRAMTFEQNEGWTLPEAVLQAA